MKKIIIFSAILNILSFFTPLLFLLIDIKSGEVIFDESTQPGLFFVANKIGPLFFGDNKTNYGASLKIEFKGRLNLNYNFRIVNSKNETIFDSNGNIIGATNEKYGSSWKGLKIFKIREIGKYFIFLELRPTNKNSSEVKNVHVQVKKNKIKISSKLYNLSSWCVLFSLALFLISTIRYYRE